MVSENVNLSVLLPTLLMFENINQAELAEMKYELTKSKEYFSEEWKKYEAEQVKFEKYLKRFPR